MNRQYILVLYFVFAQLNAIHIPQRFDNNTYNYMSDMYKNWPNGSKGKTIEIIRNIGVYTTILTGRDLKLYKYYTLEKSKKEFLKIFLARHQQ